MVEYHYVNNGKSFHTKKLQCSKLITIVSSKYYVEAIASVNLFNIWYLALKYIAIGLVSVHDTDSYINLGDQYICALASANVIVGMNQGGGQQVYLSA